MAKKEDATAQENPAAVIPEPEETAASGDLAAAPVRVCTVYLPDGAVCLRREPGKNGKFITALNHGTTVYPTAPAETHDGESWTPVKCGALEGYMMTKYLV